MDHGGTFDFWFSKAQAADRRRVAIAGLADEFGPFCQWPRGNWIRCRSPKRRVRDAAENPRSGRRRCRSTRSCRNSRRSEAEFKIERDNFTYTQTFTIQTLDTSNRPDGEYTMSSEIVFTPAGKRFEKVTYAPTSTLERISLSQQDLDDLEHVQPFVLTTSELPKYNIKYVDHVQLDELTTYVFDVAPKTIEKNQRYFQGRIWVEDKDLQIVKTDGKAVPDMRKKGGEENVFPRFETFRENIEGHYWFPTYTRSNDVLQFSSGDIPIRMVVKYENYKRFGVTIKIGQPAKVAPEQPSK